MQHPYFDLIILYLKLTITLPRKVPKKTLAINFPKTQRKWSIYLNICENHGAFGLYFEQREIMLYLVIRNTLTQTLDLSSKFSLIPQFLYLRLTTFSLRAGKGNYHVFIGLLLAFFAFLLCFFWIRSSQLKQIHRTFLPQNDVSRILENKGDS